MKNLINIGILSLVSGCFFPGPSCGFDWNCNKDISDTTWYKKRTSCITTQQEIAHNQLQRKYNKNIDSDIYSKCIQDVRYRFENDPAYKSK